MIEDTIFSIIILNNFIMIKVDNINRDNATRIVAKILRDFDI